MLHRLESPVSPLTRRPAPRASRRLALLLGAALSACVLTPVPERVDVGIDFAVPTERVRTLSVRDLHVHGSEDPDGSFDVVVDGSKFAGRYWLKSSWGRNLILVGHAGTAEFRRLGNALAPWGHRGLEDAARTAGVALPEDFRDYWSPLDVEAVPGMVLAVRTQKSDLSSDDESDVAALLRVRSLDAAVIQLELLRAPGSEVRTEEADELPIVELEDPTLLFELARAQVADGSLELARASLSRCLELAPQSGWPALWLGALGGATEPLDAITEDAEWYRAFARHFRGESDDQELSSMARSLEDVGQKDLWRQAIQLCSALQEQAQGELFWARSRYLVLAARQGTLEPRAWARELLERQQAARASLPPLPALEVAGLLDAAELLETTSDVAANFTDFLGKHFGDQYGSHSSADLFDNDGYDELELDGLPLMVQAGDRYGALLALTRRSAPRWEFLCHSYRSYYGKADSSQEPLQCVQVWTVLHEFWRVLADEGASVARKEAILRWLPSLAAPDAWYLMQTALAASAGDQTLARAMLGLMGESPFGGWSALAFLEELYSERDVSELIEAHYRLSFRLRRDSRLLAFLLAHRDEARYALPLQRLAPNDYAHFDLSPADLEGDRLLRLLQAAALPRGARVGYTYPGPYNNWEPIGLEVRFEPTQGAEVRAAVRATLRDALGADEFARHFPGKVPLDEALAKEFGAGVAVEYYVITEVDNDW